MSPPSATALTPLDELTPSALGGWAELAAGACCPVPFAEPGFVLAARALPGGSSVSLLTVTAASGMLLALPVTRTARQHGVPLSALSSSVHDYTFLGDPLVRAGAEAEAWTALLAHLRDSRAASWLLLPASSGDGPSYGGLRTAAGETGTAWQELDRHERATVRRRPEHTYLQGRVRGRHLKGLRRLRRLLSAELGGEVRVHDRTGDPGALEDFLRLEASGWKGRAGTAMSRLPGGREFLHQLQANWPDRLQLHCLGTDEQSVAVQINLRAGRSTSCFKTGFDEVHASRSPGLLLELDVLQAFHDDLELEVLDSCATSGHAMAERLFPDTRVLTTALLSLSWRGRLAGQALPVARDLWRRRPRTMEKT